jgi:DNA-binding IscR family transcriptional regulator
MNDVVTLYVLYTISGRIQSTFPSRRQPLFSPARPLAGIYPFPTGSTIDPKRPAPKLTFPEDITIMVTTVVFYVKQISTRFSMAVHILCLLATSPADCTGDFIAQSVNTNPVIIRRIMGMLKKAGLVDVRPGVGGASLRKPPDQITLLDVYRAVGVVETDQLFRIHEHPNIQCPVGRNIEAVLQAELKAAQAAMEERLSQTTISRLIAQFQ